MFHGSPWEKKVAIYCNPWRFFSPSSCKVISDSLPCASDLRVSCCFFVHREQDQGRKEFQPVQTSGIFPSCSQGSTPLESALSAVPLPWVVPPQGRERQCLLTHLCVSCDLRKAQIFWVVQLDSHTCLERVGAWPGCASGKAGSFWGKICYGR